MLAFFVVILSAHYFADQGMPKLGSVMACIYCMATLSKFSGIPFLQPVYFVGTGLSFGLMLLGSVLIIRYRMERKQHRK